MFHLDGNQLTNYSRPSLRSSTDFPTIIRNDVNNDFTKNSTTLRRSCTDLPEKNNTFYQSSKVNLNRPFGLRTVEPNGCCSHVSTMDALKLPPIFTPARNASDIRYTQNDWEGANSASYSTSDYLRNMAERLRRESVCLCKDSTSTRTQAAVGKKLDERVNDIAFWKNELIRETDEMIAENAALKEAKRMILKALSESEDMLDITKECLYYREKRQGIDLVHDSPEMALLDEVSSTRKCQEKMRKILDKLKPQLNLNLAAQYELENDAEDKFVAHNLDECAHQLHNNSCGLAYHNGLELIDTTKSDPETWCKFTNENITRSQTQRVASKQLRNELNNVLNDCSNSMCYQWNLTNQALTDRMRQTIDAKNKAQAHLSKILQEIFDMNKNIELIKKSIQDKHNPLKVAQTRLDLRLRRANMEACRDAPQLKLVGEVNEIYDTLDSLQKKLLSVEKTLHELLLLKASLENNLAIKNNTLFIDREKCLAYRKTFPMSPICEVRPRTSSDLMLNRQRPND